MYTKFQWKIAKAIVEICRSEAHTMARNPRTGNYTWFTVAEKMCKNLDFPQLTSVEVESFEGNYNSYCLELVPF